ncbi:MAG: phosphohydrolase [Burkholderiaceae bacterium]|nr:phosphohydrolase [Burkholderiaceae bacterium]
MNNVSKVPVSDAMHALAFVGNLSRGQPTNHSLRTARLAAMLAAADGASAEDCAVAYSVALLRWSGCSANAAGFGELLGDDVAGRKHMSEALQPAQDISREQIVPLAQIHCEVSGDIGAMLGMPPAVEAGLRHIYEAYNGKGLPLGLAHPDVPVAVYRVTLAGDLEVMSRVHGFDAALAYVQMQADAKYPAQLVGLLVRHASEWLDMVDAEEVQTLDARMTAAAAATEIPLTMVGDVIDLKLPWLAGHSRQVAQLASSAGAAQGLSPIVCQQLAGAGLIHGIGRAAVPNRIWNTPGKLDASVWEQVRLAPYWTWRAAQQIRSLTAEVGLASHAYERQDGSGYFRSLQGEAINVAQRTLATTVAWTALCAARPWRTAFGKDDAAAILREEAKQGRFDAAVVEAVLAAATGEGAKPQAKAITVLSERETEVLSRISLGESNKEVARSLAVSPSTVRTHVESIFRKLECSTRAAATLKAYTLGII